MIRVILAALRRHPSQAVVVAVLAALAAGIAAAVPAYLVGAAEVGTASAVESAPPRLRQVTAIKRLAGDDVARTVRTTTALTATVDRPGLRLATNVRSTGSIFIGLDTTLDRDLAYRDGVCAKVRITGACPTALGEVLISNRAANLLGLDVGSRFTYFPHRGTPLELLIAGRYQGGDEDDPFWAGGALIRSEPLFVTADTLTSLRSTEVTVTIEGKVTPELFTGVEALVDARTMITRLNRMIVNDGFAVDHSLEALADRVTANRRVIAAGVPVAGLQLLLLSWFALGLAVRHSGVAWRPDVGLLKLRGVSRGRVTLLAVGRSGLPILAGAVVGAVVALALRGRVKAAIGRAEAQPDLTVTDNYVLLGGIGAAVLAVVGSMMIAFVAERRVLREPVVDLLRRVPARQGGWRAGAAELLVVALAAAAVYQVRSAPVDDPAAAGLALFVPLLVALVVALTGTRLLVPVAAGAARRAFGAGRLSTGLALLDLARRPGARRLAALLVTASSLLVTATIGWATAATARAERAALDLGGHRVVTVGADSATHLLTAVRAADPGGRNAMAVVIGRTSEATDAAPVVAVDSPRLAAVAAWPSGAPAGGAPGQAMDPRDLAAKLRPPAAAAIVAAGKAIDLELTVPAADPPLRVTVEALLVDRRGGRITAALGPVGAGRHTVRADTPACAGGGCRLVGFELVGGNEGTGPVVLHRLGQLDPPASLVDGKGFADLARWRQPLASRKPFLVASNAGDGLALRLDRIAPLADGEGVMDEGGGPTSRPGIPDPLTLEVVDAPVPLPAVTAGNRAGTSRAGGQPRPLLGAGGVPLRQITTQSPLPRIGKTGLVVDLEYAERIVVGIDGVREVWLAEGAPADMLDRLRDQGLEIVRTETVGEATDRYAAQGGTATLRLHLVVALAGLLLAAASVVLVAAVDRPARSAEFAALRVQGVPVRAVRRSVIGGYALVTGVATVLGVLAAAAAHRLAGSRPIFDDRWELLTPTGPGWLAVVLLAGGLVAANAGAVALAAAPMIRGGAR